MDLGGATGIGHHGHPRLTPAVTAGSLLPTVLAPWRGVGFTYGERRNRGTGAGVKNLTRRGSQLKRGGKTLNYNMLQ